MCKRINLESCGCGLHVHVCTSAAHTQVLLWASLVSVYSLNHHCKLHLKRRQDPKNEEGLLYQNGNNEKAREEV
ncbi:uncharacterized protein LOC144632993 isoform X2 [Oculina patagonica]